MREQDAARIGIENISVFGLPPVEFVADDMAVVRQIHAKASLLASEAANRKISEFIANHPRGKHGRIVYNPERDFEISPAEAKAL